MDSEPPDASENEMYSSVVCYCLPGTSTSPMNDTPLDFQVLAQAQQACSRLFQRAVSWALRGEGGPSRRPPLTAGSPNASPYCTGPVSPPPLSGGLPQQLRQVSGSFRKEGMMLSEERTCKLSIKLKTHFEEEENKSPVGPWKVMRTIS